VIDAHAHLTDERFARDLETVLARAAAAGVTRVLACGEDVASSERAVELAWRQPAVRAAVGIHPHRAASCDDAALRRLRELAHDPTVVAIGEIGMDLSGRSAPPADQERALAMQLGLAVECGKPVCLHVRECGAQVRSIVDRVSGAHGYVHCFSEARDDVKSWTARGFFISFSGTVTYPRADGLRAAASAVPDDRLLVETDAPALAPQAHRGRRNEPAFIADTYTVVAAVRGITVNALAALARRNATTLFGGRW
jgi:TatD DNase family protein